MTDLKAENEMLKAKLEEMALLIKNHEELLNKLVTQLQDWGIYSKEIADAKRAVSKSDDNEEDDFSMSRYF